MLSISRRTIALGVLAMLVALAIGLGSRTHSLDPTNPAITLADIERAVEAKFEAPQIAADALASTIGDPGIIAFDVRERAEFDQSHIEGATHLSPAMSAEEFAAVYAPMLKGKKVVFYCAVGVRSSIMLNRLQGVLRESGAASAHNLQGGIFRWHASGKQTVAGSQPVHAVHPYDEHWGALLERTLKADREK